MASTYTPVFIYRINADPMARLPHNRHEDEDTYSFVFDDIPDRDTELGRLFEDEGEMENADLSPDDYYDDDETFHFEF